MTRATGSAFPHADDFVVQETIDPYTPYEERRLDHQTQLSERGPAVRYEWGATPSGARVVTYRSEGRELRGWLFVPTSAAGRPRAGVVYLHNDFALTQLSWNNTEPLREADLVVFLPSLRAENGNPGDFELLYGEVDDAANAVKWLSRRPEVDPEAVYVIGHSIGGGIAALLALRVDLPARLTASIGGTYRARTLHVWALQAETAHLVRFDPNDASEVTLRLLIPNLRDMIRPHIAYAGLGAQRDTAYARYAKDLADQVGAPFEYVAVDGHHMSSAKPAVVHFVKTIQSDRSLSSAAR